MPTRGQSGSPCHPYSSRVTPSRCSFLDFETTTVDEIFDRLLSLRAAVLPPPLATVAARAVAAIDRAAVVQRPADIIRPRSMGLTQADSCRRRPRSLPFDLS